MMVFAALSATAALVVPTPLPSPPEELLGDLDPGRPCIAQVHQALYLGGPLGSCPEPRQPDRLRIVPLEPHSLSAE